MLGRFWCKELLMSTTSYPEDNDYLLASPKYILAVSLEDNFTYFNTKQVLEDTLSNQGD